MVFLGVVFSKCDVLLQCRVLTRVIPTWGLGMGFVSLRTLCLKDMKLVVWFFKTFSVDPKHICLCIHVSPQGREQEFIMKHSVCICEYVLFRLSILKMQFNHQHSVVQEQQKQEVCRFQTGQDHQE